MASLSWNAFIRGISHVRSFNPGSLSFLRPLNLSISATEQGKVDASLLKTWSSKWHGSNELFLASPPLKRKLPTNPHRSPEPSFITYYSNPDLGRKAILLSS